MAIADVPQPVSDTSAAIEAHAEEADPHDVYQLESEKSAADGYASLDSGTKVPIAELPTGSTASTVATGDHGHPDQAAAYTAHSILAANTAGNPAPLTVDEQTLVGRITDGTIDALTVSEVTSLLSSIPKHSALSEGEANLPRAGLDAAAQMASGVLYVSYFTAQKTEFIGKVRLLCATAAAQVLDIEAELTVSIAASDALANDTDIDGALSATATLGSLALMPDEAAALPLQVAVSTAATMSVVTGVTGALSITASSSSTSTRRSLPTLCKVGFFSVGAGNDHDSDLTLLLTSDNDSSLFTVSNTAYTISFPDYTTKTAGQRYAVGVLVVSQFEMPTLAGVSVSTVGALEADVSPILSAELSGQSDISADVTSTLSTSTITHYVALLPPIATSGKLTPTLEATSAVAATKTITAALQVTALPESVPAALRDITAAQQITVSSAGVPVFALLADASLSLTAATKNTSY